MFSSSGKRTKERKRIKMTEMIILLSLTGWFFWAFIAGGLARALDGNKIEWLALTVSFIFIVTILPIILFIL